MQLDTANVLWDGRNESRYIIMKLESLLENNFFLVNGKMSPIARSARSSSQISVQISCELLQVRDIEIDVNSSWHHICEKILTNFFLNVVNLRSLLL